MIHVIHIYTAHAPTMTLVTERNTTAAPLIVGSETPLLHSKLEREPMPNVMAALANIGGALCSTPQSLADARY